MADNELYYFIYESIAKKAGDDVDYFVKVSDDKVYLGFRGSHSFNDWVNDFKFPARLYKHQENKFFVHGGFGEAYKSANDAVMNDFIKACNDNPECTPTIIGHSLGGAMAILAMEDYNFRTGKKANLITFGCPRTLWGKKSRSYFYSCAKSVTQYEVNNDLVPRVLKIYTNLRSVQLGEKYNWKKMIRNVAMYHTSYGDLGLYV